MVSLPSVLGVCSGTHDSAAALIAEGKLIGLVEEERLNSEKHTRAYPQRAIAWLLEETGLTHRDIAAVAYNFDPAAYRRGVWTNLGYLATVSSWHRALPRAQLPHCAAASSRTPHRSCPPLSPRDGRRGGAPSCARTVCVRGIRL